MSGRAWAKNPSSTDRVLFWMQVCAAPVPCIPSDAPPGYSGCPGILFIFLKLRPTMSCLSLSFWPLSSLRSLCSIILLLYPLLLLLFPSHPLSVRSLHGITCLSPWIFLSLHSWPLRNKEFQLGPNRARLEANGFRFLSPWPIPSSNFGLFLSFPPFGSLGW